MTSFSAVVFKCSSSFLFEEPDEEECRVVSESSFLESSPYIGESEIIMYKIKPPPPHFSQENTIVVAKWTEEEPFERV